MGRGEDMRTWGHEEMHPSAALLWLCCHPQPWPCCSYCCAWETTADLPLTPECGSSLNRGWLLQLKRVLSCDTGSLQADAGHSTASCNQTVNGGFWECRLESHGPGKGLEREKRKTQLSVWTVVQPSISRTVMLFTITVGKHICDSNTQNSLSPHPVITQWRKQMVQPSSTTWHYLNTLGCALCQSCFLCCSVIPFMRAWALGPGEHR